MPQGYLTINRLLVLVAIIIFILAAFGVSLGSFGQLGLGLLGLAVWAAAQLVP